MASRRWISWIAVIGMLLHAGTLARHNVFRFEQAIAGQAAAVAKSFRPGATCQHHEASPQDEGKRKDQPDKSPGGAASNCPICLGHASAHAMLACGAPALRVPQVFLALDFIPGDLEAAPVPTLRRPSNRGPPSIA